MEIVTDTSVKNTLWEQWGEILGRSLPERRESMTPNIA